MKYSLSILIYWGECKIFKSYLNYCSIAAFGFLLLTCQSNKSSENSIADSEQAKASSTDESLPQSERIIQKVERIRELQEQLRAELDSLNSLDTNSELQSYSDTLQRSYFILADAEAAWVSFRSQHQFDSLNAPSRIAAFNPELDSLEQLLDASIQQAEESASAESGIQ